ncbi:50S ribosomal protein L3 [Candidatus Pacearchaeota archaeon]|nr:50S ribosomal protein L3 [Candidatus Pacearchaeota archaeon]
MAKRSFPRSGSLQIWPRKRVSKFIPSVNWSVLQGKGMLGIIAYKVGMKSALVKDNTQNSMTKDKKIIIPATILEIPPVKIYSARLYKNNLCLREIVLNSDKELKKILKIGKDVKGKIEELDKKDFDDLRVIIYSQTKKTGIKKTPDIAEIGLGGSIEEKINFVKQNWNKEISASEIIKKMQLVDVRGLTKGHGLEGPVKRFGIGLKTHKTEKGVRRPGSLGPWHPHLVTFRVAQAGQLGMFTRIIYNNKILEIGRISEKNINPKQGWKNYGNIQTEYIILKGNVQGPSKRQILLTMPLRKTKYQEKKNLEFLELR